VDEDVVVLDDVVLGDVVPDNVVLDDVVLDDVVLDDVVLDDVVLDDVVLDDILEEVPEVVPDVVLLGHTATLIEYGVAQVRRHMEFPEASEHHEHPPPA